MRSATLIAAVAPCIVTPKGEKRGKYVSVWRRQPDGAWKIVADIGAPGDAEPGAGP
jgi:ketosteroid isomerase-like protein